MQCDIFILILILSISTSVSTISELQDQWGIWSNRERILEMCSPLEYAFPLVSKRIKEPDMRNWQSVMNRIPHNVSWIWQPVFCVLQMLLCGLQVMCFYAFCKVDVLDTRYCMIHVVWMGELLDAVWDWVYSFSSDVTWSSGNFFWYLNTWKYRCSMTSPLNC